MKKFVFPLARVMEWRRTQVRIEEVKLERLHSELHSMEERERALASEVSQARQAVTRAVSVTGFELSALDRYQKAVAATLLKWAGERAELSPRIAAQVDIVALRRRDLRLLERLRDQRLADWHAAFDRETEQQAQESFLAKWNVRPHR